MICACSLLQECTVLAIYLGVCALIAYALSSGQKVESQEEQKQAADAATQGADIASLASNLIGDQPPTKHEKENPNKPLKSAREYLQRDIRQPRIWIEILALGAVIVYTCIMNTSNELTRQNFEASQRAAIFETRVEMIETSPELLKEFPKDVAASIDTHFKNFGPTPATEVIEMSSPCLLKGDIPSDFSYRDLGELPHPKRLVPPQEEFIDGIPSRVEDIDAALAYQASLFVWGTVTYIDVFKKSHFTAFCVKYEATGQTANDSKSRVQKYEQCPDHNCVDENCPKNHRWGYDDSIDCLNVGPSAPTHVPAPPTK